MRSFDDIEKAVFCGETDFEPANCSEKEAYLRLGIIFDKYKKSEINRETASRLKAKLKEKYEKCLEHEKVLEEIKLMIFNATWDFEDEDLFIPAMLDKFWEIGSRTKTGFDLYGKMAANVVDYFDELLKTNPSS